MKRTLGNWKVKPWRSPKYMKWISSLECCITDAPGPNDPHHSNEPGHGTMGGKCSDARCLPLAHWLHQEVERGEAEFWEFWGKDPEALIAFYNAEWIRLGNTFDEKRRRKK